MPADDGVPSSRADAVCPYKMDRSSTICWVVLVLNYTKQAAALKCAKRDKDGIRTSVAVPRQPHSPNGEKARGTALTSDWRW